MSTQAAGSSATPLDSSQTQSLQQAIAGLDTMQLQWISGYTAGLAAASNPAPLPATGPANSMTVLYGSQTGNGE